MTSQYYMYHRNFDSVFITTVRRTGTGSSDYRFPSRAVTSCNIASLAFNKQSSFNDV
uniref:Uncharacterized protein n=1 Tax=Octopus bimaculoides TaxID=37653 RepID=A0A0L8I8C7_OCTBM